MLRESLTCLSFIRALSLTNRLASPLTRSFKSLSRRLYLSSRHCTMSKSQSRFLSKLKNAFKMSNTQKHCNFWKTCKLMRSGGRSTELTSRQASRGANWNSRGMQGLRRMLLQTSQKRNWLIYQMKVTTQIYCTRSMTWSRRSATKKPPETSMNLSCCKRLMQARLTCNCNTI